MFIKSLVCGLSLLMSSPIWSFTCYYTLAKDNCWTNYNVSVDVVDEQTQTVLTTVKVPAGKSWTRQQFECEPKQKLMYRAQFTPAFWDNEAGKVYSALRFWFMPDTINPGDKAWTIPVCFPEAFASVPFPPDAKPGTAAVIFSVIPAVAP